MRTIPVYSWPISHEPAVGACAKAEARVKRTVKGKECVRRTARQPLGNDKSKGSVAAYTTKLRRSSKSYTVEDACRLLAMALQKLDI